MRYRSSFMIAGWTALLVGGAGCISAQERPAPSLGGAASAEGRASCPMLVPGAEVRVTDTPDGVSLEFTTGSDNAEELRNSVRHWADLHATAEFTMPRRRAAGHGGMIGGHGMNIASTARIEDIPGGARVVLTPLNPADLDRLRAEARRHEEPMGAADPCIGMMEQR